GRLLAFTLPQVDLRAKAQQTKTLVGACGSLLERFQGRERCVEIAFEVREEEARFLEELGHLRRGQWRTCRAVTQSRTVLAQPPQAEHSGMVFGKLPGDR